MFDTIGRPTDAGSRRRQAQSALLTLMLLAGTAGLAVGMLATRAIELADEDPDSDEMIEVVVAEVNLEETAPPAPPPPARGTPDATTEPDPPAVDDPIPAELPDEVPQEVASTETRGTADGTADGHPDGVPGGVRHGKPGGQLGGTGTGGPVSVHHSELEIRSQRSPHYPEAAKALGLGEQRCKVRVWIDDRGKPTRVAVEDCPKVFHESARQAVMRWSWYPARAEGKRVAAQTVYGITYKLR